MTTEQQAFWDSYRNCPQNIHAAFDRLSPRDRDDILNPLHATPDIDAALRRISFIDEAFERINDSDTIDDDAWVSESASGAYVQAWIWVPNLPLNG